MEPVSYESGVLSMRPKRSCGKEMFVKPAGTVIRGEVPVQLQSPKLHTHMKTIEEIEKDYVNTCTKKEEYYRNTKGIAYHLRSMRNFGYRITPMIKLEITD